MNNVKFLLSVSIGILAYVLIVIFAGPDGLWAYNQLGEQKNILSINVEKIQKINDNLYLDHKALENDVGMITSRARNLGFIYEGEKLIKINGIAENNVSVYDTGSVVKLGEISYVSEDICKLLGLACFLMSLTIFCLVDLKSKNRLKTVAVATSVFSDYK
jgi:cell division protein FtsB